MKRTLLIPSVLLLLLGAFCFWVSAENKTADVLTVGFADDIKTLDVGSMSWMSDLRVAAALWEGLTIYDNTTLAPIPGVAEKWDISPDGLTYTFHLRHNGQWSNGEPVTARDFIFAWRRALMPVTAGDYVSLLQLIDGGQEYYDRLNDSKNKVTPAEAISLFDKVQVHAPDDYTLVVKLKSPCTYFLDLVAFGPFYPLNEKAMASHLIENNPLLGYDPGWTRPPELVSNGPFTLVKWRVKESLLLERNEHYWDKANVLTKRLEIKPYTDPIAGWLAYQKHDVEVLYVLPPTLAPDMVAAQKEGRFRDLHGSDTFASYYYIFNCKRKPFDDARVRRAMSLVIDRKQIVDSVTRLPQKPLAVLVPPGTIKVERNGEVIPYESPHGLDRNVEEAQRLLAEAGYPDGKGFPPVEILYNTEGVHDRICQAMGQMWLETLHIRTTYKGLERSTFGSDRRDHNFDIARAGWTGDYADPTTWLDLLRTDNGNNDGLYSSAKYDEIMKQSDREADPAKRFALLTEAEKLIMEQDLPVIPLYQYYDGYIYDENTIAGSDPNVRLLLQFKFVHRK